MPRETEINAAKSGNGKFVSGNENYKPPDLILRTLKVECMDPDAMLRATWLFRLVRQDLQASSMMKAAVFNDLAVIFNQIHAFLATQFS